MPLVAFHSFTSWCLFNTSTTALPCYLLRVICHSILSTWYLVLVAWYLLLITCYFFLLTLHNLSVYSSYLIIYTYSRISHEIDTHCPFVRVVLQVSKLCR